MPELVFWQCIGNIRFLRKFIAKVEQYFEHSTVPGRYDRPVSRDNYPIDEVGQKARDEINYMIPRVRDLLQPAGVYPLVIGQEAYPIDLLTNIFRLEQFGQHQRTIVDHVQRGIGYYKNELPGSLWRTINPFWWLSRLVATIIRVPFKILDWAGYDGSKVETSSGGRLYKAVAGIAAFIVTLVTFLAGIVQILDGLGFTQPIKQWVNQLFQ
jgi:hypothetical protein